MTTTANSRKISRTGSGWPFVAPFALLVLAFLIVPTLYGIGLSFTSQSLMGRGGFVGLDNYVKAFSDPVMWQTMGNTLLFTLLSTVPLVIVALVMALLVQTGMPGQWLWRFAFFAPYLLPVAVVVQIWVWLFQPQLGLINNALEAVGIAGPQWLTQPGIAMWAMVILTLWWTVGFNFLLYLSALQAIPDHLYEAASIDGAGPWRRLWSITLPQLNGTTTLVVVLQVIASLKVFDQMFIAFNGGPGPQGSTRPILQYVYDTGFTDYRVGYASAISYVYFALIIVITIVLQLIIRRRNRNV
ncbi:MAG TPA: sugar ABC transporter permease [Arachnia sp.]|jgi:multiple sugar transport system permease protein|nr:sugar ABC transporter permease [Arachnia sp.]HMR13005.1 sugar ABC transporter permease [Arachnia sp.]